MILPKLFCVLSRRELHHNRINHCNESTYKKPIIDLEPNPELVLDSQDNSLGEKVFYCVSIKELFPRHTKPTNANLIKIRPFLGLGKDVPPDYIWLCINIHADRIAQNDDIMFILRNDPNALHIEDE